MNADITSGPPEHHSTTPRKAALAAWLGTALEFYDFTAYAVAAATVFPVLFFPASNPTAGTLAALAAFGIGYIVRPLGSLLWGHLGDRLGRRPVLLFTMMTMGVATTLLGCTPGYQTIGIAAPIVLVLLRIVQGLSAAGEQPGANAVVLEHAPANRRAFYSSFASSGNTAGALLANAVFLPLSAFLPHDQLLAWGWRVPFWLSAVLVVIGLLIRRRLDETPAFIAQVAAGTVPRNPLRILFTRHWRALIRVVLMLLFTAIGTLTSVWALSFGTRVAEVRPAVLLWAGLASMIVGQFVIPLAGSLADRLGRRPVFAIGGFGAMASLFPMFWAISVNRPPLIILFQILTVGVFSSFVLATIAAFAGELFPTEVRLSGTSVGLQVGIAIGGGLPPVIASAIAGPGPGGWFPVAVLGAALALVSTVAALAGRETAGIDASTDTGEQTLDRHFVRR